MTGVQEYTESLLAETREELGRADTKASILFASFGLVVAAILAGIINGKWEPADLACGATVVFWIGGCLAIGAFVALGYTLWPRITHEEAAGPATYYGHVRAFKGNRSALRNALERGAANNERALEQLIVISDIVWRKFVGIRWAIGLFVVGAVMASTAVVFG